jgi:DNA-binding Lrp family transcriptional regulator
MVNVVLGTFDVVAHVLLPDETFGIHVLAEEIGRVAGVQSVRPNVTLEMVKFDTRHARLPLRPVPLSFPNPVVEMDDLDRALLEVLIRDGRRSNRGAARALGVSEGTIRLRLRRMEHAGLLRITARSDPYLTGDVNAWAMLGVDAERGATRQVANELAELSETASVALIAGSHDILASVAAVSRSRLVELVLEDIRALPGVRSTTTWEIVHTTSANHQWARLMG